MQRLLEIEMHPPSFAVFSNVYRRSSEHVCRKFVELLQDQVTGTVAPGFDCMEGIDRAGGAIFFIELGPGGVLGGIV